MFFNLASNFIKMYPFYSLPLCFYNHLILRTSKNENSHFYNRNRRDIIETQQFPQASVGNLEPWDGKTVNYLLILLVFSLGHYFVGTFFDYCQYFIAIVFKARFYV